MTKVELSSEKWYLSLGPSVTLSLSHWNMTLVPLSTAQDQVTFAWSSTTACGGLFATTGTDTGTGKTEQALVNGRACSTTGQVVMAAKNTHRPLLRARFFLL